MINAYVKEAALTTEEEDIYRTSKLTKENLYLRLRRTRCKFQVRPGPNARLSRLNKYYIEGFPSFITSWAGWLWGGLSM